MASAGMSGTTRLCSIHLILHQASQASSQGDHRRAREQAKTCKHLTSAWGVTFINMPSSKANHMLSPEHKDGIEQTPNPEQSKGSGYREGCGMENNH